jgi:hypothetical protein
VLGSDQNREANPNAEPTEDQILLKAKELCHNDGKAWDITDFEEASEAVTLAGVADESAQTQYLHQAASALKREA